MVNMNAMLYGMMAGQQVGQYHLKSLLGAGGFGGVFRANEVVRDRVLRQVAVKVILGNDEQQLEELLAAATLEHDHLVRCYAAGECSLFNIDALYLAMELAEGSLETHLQQGPLESAKVREVITEVTAGLAYLHSQNQVHRDLKPGNVLRARERWKLSDFGLVRRLGSDSYAQTANPIGTIAYMPAEAFEGTISPAWDMWSLGIMVVQMVSANLPYRFSEPTQLFKQVMNGELQLPLLPEEFRTIVEGCLQVEHRTRWTAKQVLEALSPQSPVVQIPSSPSPLNPQHAKGRIVKPTTPSSGAFHSTIMKENLGGGVILELVKLSGGQFMMGASGNTPEEHNDEKPQHLVKVKAFAMGKYPITQAQYEAIMGENPSRFKGNPNHPVERVSWLKSQAFCQKLSQATGKQYRLPSEAKWEYACRAGTITRYFCGDNADQLKDYAWYDENSNGSTHPVGEKQSNPWGLYDMYGNVWELCEDGWHHNYRGAPRDGKPWVQNNDNIKVLRGGSWCYSSRLCLSSTRLMSNADNWDHDIGFRVVILL